MTESPRGWRLSLVSQSSVVHAIIISLSFPPSLFPFSPPPHCSPFAYVPLPSISSHVATPGRLNDLLMNGILNVKTVTYLVRLSN